MCSTKTCRPSPSQKAQGSVIPGSLKTLRSYKRKSSNSRIHVSGLSYSSKCIYKRSLWNGFFRRKQSKQQFLLCPTKTLFKAEAVLKCKILH